VADGDRLELVENTIIPTEKLEEELKMAIYDKEQGFQSILNVALGEYQSKGFRLVEPDDHCLYLYYQDERVGILSQSGATIPVIREACQEHLESLSAS